MNPAVKNLIGLVLGIIVGMIVNMGIIMISGNVIALPEGVDPTDMESLKAAMPTMEAKHFLMPFLAHALGTLIGAFVAVKIVATRHRMFALIIGLWFLLGGIANCFLLPGPTWFNITDIALAYIPMALLGWKLGMPKG